MLQRKRQQNQMTHHDFQHDFSAQAAELLKQVLAAADSCAPDQSPAPCFLKDLAESGTVVGSHFSEPRFETEARGPALTIGLPWLSCECSLRWCGLRLFWWPRGIPFFRRCVILSSRPGRPRYDQKSWFADLRSSVAELNPSLDCLVVDSSVWASRVVERAAELAQVHVLRFRETDRRTLRGVDNLSMAEWLAQQLRTLRNHDQDSGMSVPGAVRPVDVSPVLLRGTLLSSNGSEIANRPLADRLLFASAETIRVLHCREGGHTEALIRHHQNDPDRRNVPVLFCTDQFAAKTKEGEQPRTRPNKVNSARVKRDASMEHATGTACSTSEIPSEDTTERIPFRTAAVTASDNSCPLRDPADWLLHWTRACDGPWPGQSENDWLDELITGSPSADHSAFATLKRIAEQGLLIASSSGIRGKYPVVCFTEVPLTEFAIMRTFRRHRHRHDFEPWGVAVRRSALISLGARSVLYGDDSLWETLSQSDRPWFQRECSGADTKHPHGISVWANEREWRVAGDLNLQQIRQEDVCWFVRDAESARQLSQSTNRRVIVVPRTD